jgi:hypothetical protein
MDDLTFLAEDAATDRVASDAKLTELRDKLKEFVAAKQLVDSLTAQLEEASQAYFILASELVPAKFDELGFQELRLDSGELVRLKPFVSAKDTDEGRAWLRDNNHGDIIKSVVTVDLGKNEELRELLTELLGKLQIQFEEKTGVATNTLKAFLKNELEAGREVPLPLFNAYVGRVAEIKVPKKA